MRQSEFQKGSQRNLARVILRERSDRALSS